MRKNKVVNGLIGFALAGSVTLGLAACGSDGSGSASGSSKTSATATAAPTPVAQIASLSGKTGQSTAVKLDQGFVDALTTLKLAPGVVGDAKLTDGSLIFPITSGNLTYYKPRSIYPYVQGDIQHDGSGFSLTAGSTKVELTNFDIDPGTSKLYGDVSVNGKPAADHAYLFLLDGKTLNPLKTGADDTAILQGTTVKMSADAAGLLNATFKTDAVKKDLVIGIATITVKTK